MTTELDRAVDRVALALARHARAVDEEARFPDEGMRALREAGLLGLLVPRELGGLGADLATFSSIARTLAGSCLSTAMVWAMHCQQVAILAAHAGDELRRSLLPRIAAGQVYLASVTTDPQNGGDPLAAFCPLVDEGPWVSFARDAPVVTGGLDADGYLMTARASDAATPAQVVFVYADRAQVELAVADHWSLLGMRGTRNVGMQLRGRVPRSQIVGGPDGGPDIVSTVLIPVGHVAWASCWLGAARGMLVQVVEHLRTDGRRRKGLGSDLLAVRLARVEMELDAVEVYLGRVIDDHAAAVASTDGAGLRSYTFQRRLNSLKVMASDAAFAAVDQLLLIAGFRAGYLRDAELPIERAFRDLRSASLMVANDRLLLVNGKTLLMGWEGA